MPNVNDYIKDETQKALDEAAFESNGVRPIKPTIETPVSTAPEALEESIANEKLRGEAPTPIVRNGFTENGKVYTDEEWNQDKANYTPDGKFKTQSYIDNEGKEVASQTLDTVPTNVQKVRSDMEDNAVTVGNKTENALESATTYNENKALNYITPMVDVMYGLFPEAEQYVKNNPVPTSPEYDKRREKALIFKDAIGAIGRLGSVIHDVKTLKDDGVVFAKDMGKTEHTETEKSIANLKNTFATQYDNYLEADKLYRKELNAAIKNDIANRKSITEKLIPQFKEQYTKNISYTSRPTLDEFRMRRAARYAVGAKEHYVTEYTRGRDNSGQLNNFKLTTNERYALRENAIGILQSNSDYLEMFYNHIKNSLHFYESKGNLEKDIIESLRKIPDSTSPREATQKILNGKYGTAVAYQFLVDIGDPQMISMCEVAGGYAPGSISAGREYSDMGLRELMSMGIINDNRIANELKTLPKAEAYTEVKEMWDAAYANALNKLNLGIADESDKKIILKGDFSTFINKEKTRGKNDQVYPNEQQNTQPNDGGQPNNGGQPNGGNDGDDYQG